MDEQTGDPVWRSRAERWTAGLESQKTRTDTHDLGFMIFDSFGWQYQLTNDRHARDVAVQAARSLATRFNPAVGAIKSWDVDPNDPQTPGWRFPVIIDNLMNLQLLSWAAVSESHFETAAELGNAATGVWTVTAASIKAGPLILPPFCPTGRCSSRAEAVKRPRNSMTRAPGLGLSPAASTRRETIIRPPCFRRLGAGRGWPIPRRRQLARER